ncbi:MAG: hypothetical protein CW346_12680 [Bacillaceae bacterium]|nr:hypothetical protein [Bacillaceae bacterium]
MAPDGRKTDRQTSCAEKEWGVPVSPYSACGRPVLFFAKGASFPLLFVPEGRFGLCKRQRAMPRFVPPRFPWFAFAKRRRQRQVFREGRDPPEKRIPRRKAPEAVSRPSPVGRGIFYLFNPFHSLTIRSGGSK